MIARNWHELYFDWLRRKVGVTMNPNPRRRHWLLLEQLINTEFEWHVCNDDNRAGDGKALRQAFISEFSADPGMSDSKCSMLEMLVALCDRLSFEDGKSVEQWFWELMENVGLRRFNDEYYEDHEDTYEDVHEILTRIIRRDYDANGEGGLFPLANPKEDQREVELWYQMSAYLLEDEE